MAYTIPVVALVIDEKAAAAALNEKPDYFEDPRNDRYLGVDALAKLTGAPVTYFADEDQDLYYIGLQVEEDFRIDLGPTLISKAASLRAQYSHPLVQSAQLAVVSTFC